MAAAADHLIIGASHAGLAALHALRMHDAHGRVTMVTNDAAAPYSPTILPYVVSGRSRPERVALRDQDYFSREEVTLMKGAPVAAVDTARSVVRMQDGTSIDYGKLLVASGARPALPSMAGLAGTPYHVLRSLDDAIALRDAVPGARHAVVLGAGLIGMHAAENLARAGIGVAVVEIAPHVLPGYFDGAAAAMIEATFAAHGVAIHAGVRPVAVEGRLPDRTIRLEDGSALPCDLLVVGVGVTPNTAFLAGSGIALDKGVLVDAGMRTSVSNVWAAGDVAQGPSFFGSAAVLNGIVPDAVEQGTVAGMAMAGDPALVPYRGAVPLNTYAFFGEQALAVGIQEHDAAGADVVCSSDVPHRRYLKLVLRENRLLGIFGINTPFDPGIMWELILRRIDLAGVRGRLAVDPLATARLLMSRAWR